MTQPDITVRQQTSPYSVLASIDYIQTAPSGETLPVLQGRDSDLLYFRIYNNFALNTGVADAVNVFLTTYDGAGVGSHTALQSITSQTWIHMLENGYGASVTTPGVFTSFIGSDTAIGGNYSYSPEKASDGTGSSKIRAGSDNNGVGFIEFKSYARLPQEVGQGLITFVVSINYEWTS